MVISRNEVCLYQSSLFTSFPEKSSSLPYFFLRLRPSAIAGESISLTLRETDTSKEESRSIPTRELWKSKVEFTVKIYQSSGEDGGGSGSVRRETVTQNKPVMVTQAGGWGTDVSRVVFRPWTSSYLSNVLSSPILSSRTQNTVILQTKNKTSVTTSDTSKKTRPLIVLLSVHDPFTETPTVRDLLL